MALADDESPAFVARAMNAIGSLFIDMPKVAEAFRGNGALSWGAHHPCLFSGTEWFFRTGYRAELPNWIAALDGVAAKLHTGAKVADVGCGHGGVGRRDRPGLPGGAHHRVRLPRPLDHDRRGAGCGGGRVDSRRPSRSPTPRATTAASTSSASSTACTTWAIPSASPVTRSTTWPRTAPCSWSSPSPSTAGPQNLAGNPMAALLYTASSGICTPNSLSQEVGLGLGAQAGEGRLREVFEEAGFTTFRRAAETPLNLILEAKR